MNFIDFFALQLSTEAEVLAATSMARAVRSLRGPLGFDTELGKFASRFPERCAYQWFEPLIEAAREYYQPEDEVPVEKVTAQTPFIDPIEAFLGKCLTRLNGVSIHESGKLWSLVDFSDTELSKPHMQWLPILLKRHNVLTRKCSKAAMQLARLHPLLQIDDKVAEALSSLYDTDDDKVMSFVQYVKWYKKSQDWLSEALMDGLVMKQFTESVQLLLMTGLSAERCQSSMAQVANIHPQLRPQVDAMIADIISNKECL